MLIVKSTPNLFGISLQGDYQDLQALYDSISRYLDFYQTNEETFPYHEYEYLLSLNYDIRHAYMGSRETVCIENNASETGIMAESIYELPPSVKKENRSIRTKFADGNLYFSVNILYPLVFHYLIAFESILGDYMLPDENSKTPDYPDYSYTLLQAVHDRAQIAFFNALLWDNVSEVFGNQIAEMLYEYFEDMEYYLPAPSLYIDALLHCQCVQFDSMTPEEKKQFLLASLFEIMGTEDLFEDEEELYAKELELFDTALSLLADHNRIFPTLDEFFETLEDSIPSGQPLYENVFEQFLEDHYGNVADEYAEPDW